MANSHLAGLDGRLEEANRLLNGGDLDRAEALVNDVLREDEQLAQALTLAGVIAQRRGNSEIAITFVNRALAVDPNNPIAFITGGQAYRTLGNLRAAEDCLRQALKLDPGRHDAHLNLALTLWSSGEHARAGTYFKNVLLLAPQSFQAFFYLGRIHLEDADWVRAEEYLRKAVEIQPAHAEANRLLAQVLSSAGRVPEASSALERAVLANPADGGLRLAAACAAFELGYETSAFEHYRQRGLGSDTRSAGSRPMSSREIGFGPWCQEQQIETVRVARQQRHKVREVKVIPEHHRTPDMPEPNTPEVHVAQLPDCTVLPGDHLLLSAVGSVCIGGVLTRPLHRLFTSPNIVRCADDGRLLLRLPDREQRVTAPCAYLGSADSYFDWVFECLTRLWAYHQRPGGREMPLLVQPGLSDGQRAVLAALGYDAMRLIEAVDDARIVCHSLTVASVSAPLNFVAPFSLEFLRRALRAGSSGETGPRRLFLSRQGMDHRRLTNFPEIARLLEKHDFQIVDADTPDTLGLMRLLQTAECVIGMETEAMANVFVAPAHTRVAMVTADPVRASRYCGPSRALGQEFTFLQGEADFGSHPRLSECDLQLDPRILESFLERV